MNIQDMQTQTRWSIMDKVYIEIIILSSICGVCFGRHMQDWLVTPVTSQTKLTMTSRGSLLLTNGLISREFQLSPDLFTVDFYSNETRSSLLRAVSPEAVIALDGRVYDVGGILTDTPRAYLNRSALEARHQVNPDGFHYVSHKTSAPQASFPYTPSRFAPSDIVWPPKGLRVDFIFKPPLNAPSSHQGVLVIVHYEMYDGIPLVAKWITVTKNEAKKVESNSNNKIEKTQRHNENVEAAILSVEYLAVNKPWAKQGFSWLDVSTDQPPHGISLQWIEDPEANKMPGSFQYNLNCSYTRYFTIPLDLHDFESYRVFELVVATSDPERSGLARRRLLRLLAPQTQENPIFFHMTDAHPDKVKSVLDQMSEVGFEMMIYSFGSGFDIESSNQTYIEEIRDIISYAKSKNIEVGGYDLVSLTRNPGPAHSQFAAIDPVTMKPTGNACFASGWYEYLLDKFTGFMNATGLSMVETDGPYGSFDCASHNHSHHTGLQDNIYWNVYYQGMFFKKLRELRVYINQPDDYFFYGGSKTAMGYSEQQYSLPKWQDLSVSRQGMFDDMYHYIPTIGWMFMPLVQYHGGGDSATFEPLTQNKLAFEWGLAQYLGSGVAACYRGYRLYDSDVTKAIVKKWVTFYKQYRDILISDVIHVRRADMQGLDCLMHVNSKLTSYKALAMVFNPTDQVITSNLTLPLYYTGLTDTVIISEQDKTSTTYKMDRFFEVDITVKLNPYGITWYIVKSDS